MFLKKINFVLNQIDFDHHHSQTLIYWLKEEHIQLILLLLEQLVWKQNPTLMGWAEL